jgi:glycosyltransferase involved in cell wall biosynthesis
MKKILIIGMADSVHLANWIQNMVALPVEVTLVSSSPHRRVHPKIIELMATSNPRGLAITMPNWSRRFGLILWVVDRFLGERIRGRLVKNLVQKLKPDLVHAVEFQHAGYVLIRALEKSEISGRPLIMVSNYGSDIYWFQKFSAHRKKISSILEMANLYTSECSRDIALATKLGFLGKSTLIPNTGGIRDDLLVSRTDSSSASERQLLLLKGYHNKFGQALVAINSLRRVRKHLSRFEITSVSTNYITAVALILLRLTSGLKVSFHLKGALTNSEVLTLMSRARIYIGLSKSDGISTSLLEAMSMGAFPIQTKTACASEWIESGKSGAIVSLDELNQLDSWIKMASSDDALVDVAQAINAATIISRYTNSLMKSRVEQLYLDSLNGS